VRNSAAIQRWIVPIAVLAAWEAFGDTAVLPRYLPPPSQIVVALYDLAVDGELLQAVFISLSRSERGQAPSSD
jgi:ABC-type nitrate/sulfonate/bicarbonate transport system permease component